MKKYLYLFCCLSFLNNCLVGQKLGLLTFQKDKIADGYTLIYPHNQPTVFLINNCGNVVHKWDDVPTSRPGNTAYLLPNGNLVKTKRPAAVTIDSIWSGGGGATIEIVNWDNTSIWSYTKNDNVARLHHDIAVMPNGNILAIVWEKLTKQEAINLGRNPSLIAQNSIWPDAVYELNPNTNTVVWTWRSKDHLIQDFDNTKANFGVVADHPELIDFNYDTAAGASSWMHVNAIDYNAELDQILLSSPYFNELWIIDHSTTTAQAASHQGGRSNKGGDLMYRVGNPAAYKQGTKEDQDLFFQHDATWVQNLPFSHPDYNKILVFNNRKKSDASAMEVFETPWNMYDWGYDKVDKVYPPVTFDNSLHHPGPRPFFSAGLSSVQLLPNNNILMMSGAQGYLTEMTRDKEIVWEYILPFKNGKSQATNVDLMSGDNNMFRAYKYPADFLAFAGKDLSPKGNLELDPDVTLCERLVGTTNQTIQKTCLYPNPASQYLWISGDLEEVNRIIISDANGKKIKEISQFNSLGPLNIADLTPGVYYLKLNGLEAEQFIKH